LLNLIDEKGKHHENGKYRTQVFLAKTIIVLEIVPLVLEGVESFILDFPSGTAGPHKLEHVFFGDRYINNPTEFRDLFIFVYLPVFEHVDQQVRMAFIKGNLVHKTKKMRFLSVL
jgi:hypothetical protein